MKTDLFERLEASTLELLNEHGVLREVIKKELVRDYTKDEQISEEEMQNIETAHMQTLNISKEEYLERKNSQCSEFNRYIEANIRSIKLTNKAEREYGHMVQSKYLDIKDSLDIIIYSLIRTQDPFLARELFIRINEEEERFEDMAELYSEGEEKYKKGLVGPVAVGQAHPFLRKILKTTKPQELTGPIQIDRWNLLIKIESIKESKLDNILAKRLCVEIFNEYLEKVTGEMIQLWESTNQRASSV